MIAYHYPPFQGGSGIQRTLKFSEYLPHTGWQPIVLTASIGAYRPGAGPPERISPLVTLQLERDEHHAYLYWRDSCGAGEHWRFLLEASMTSLVAMSRWLSGQRLPWQCSFSHGEPHYVEQYWVHLGEHTRFARPLDMMCIPREYLVMAWPGASATVASSSRPARRNTAMTRLRRSRRGT